MERRDASVEARGKNVEEAIASGLATLGLSRDQVEVEVISRGSRGVLGLGAEDARVLILALPKPEIKPEIRHEPLAVTTPPPRVYEEPKRIYEEPKKKMPAPLVADVDAEESLEHPQGEEPGEAPDLEEVQQIARESLDTLLHHMDIRADVNIKEPSGFMVEGNNPPPIVLDIEGDDLGVLIGRRGETLGAIQYMVRLIVNHRTKRWVNIVVDVEGYKERRERQLRQLAERMAERAVSGGRPVTLEAMPAYERRIVHLALRDHPQVTTHSIGEGENRKVTIFLKQDAQ